jgi:hypothetical protein
MTGCDDRGWILRALILLARLAHACIGTDQPRERRDTYKHSLCHNRHNRDVRAQVSISKGLVILRLFTAAIRS